MRVLLSAIACHPEHGSEGAVGWKSALALARSHEVHVLTSAENRESIESHLEKYGICNPSFTYFGHRGAYHKSRLIARGQSWLRYLRWMRGSLGEAQRLLATRPFDLVHHVTFSTYRVASPLWKLGLPFVFGPVGGAEKLPWIAAGSMSQGQQLHEFVRLLANASTHFSAKLRATIRNSAAIIASNQITADALVSIGAARSRIWKLPVVFFSDEEIKNLRVTKIPTGPKRNHLKLFSSGMLEGRKGLSIAFEAVRLAVDSGIKIEFTIPSRGPEFAFLRQLAQKLSLTDVIRFPESLPREKYWAQLRDSDVYMAPSLRDNCPATLLEAMLCRCVPIVANCNGPGEVVSENVGEVIEPDQPGQMAREIAVRLIRLAENASEIMAKSEAASNYVASSFTETRYLQYIEEAYTSALAFHKEKMKRSTEKNCSHL
jgi:glycosyltransferase involved in cell wall biosynthesis